ncbi:MAG TPA: NAD-dependent epimerase/dehydratase family protein [Pseudonocardiaceae bacterium]|jgi:nucleoside-diphosphate-sugar epimerase|nr:NAD-dependent epimerase/dehydratase family protein [Pseudonocardiaceae bacterium]
MTAEGMDAATGGSATAGVRVVIIGATGNVGTSVVSALGQDPQVGSILGVARRLPQWQPPKTEWVRANVAEDDLVSLLRGADVVIHLAWLFQPTHDPVTTWRNNVLGGIRVFDAVADAGVSALVYASSVGAYSPGPKDRAVTERWPTHGWPGAAYTREKAYLERVLDSFELRNPGVRVVRLRPGFIFKQESASEQRRLFAGPLLPNRLVRPGLIPVIPDLPGLRFQAMHTADAAEAYRLAALQPVRGAFNIAAEPVIDAAMLASCLNARIIRVPAWPVRAAVSASWWLHLVPASPGLLDAVLRLPVMDLTRARTELGWSARHSSSEAIMEFLQGLRQSAGMPTPPLSPRVPGGRAREITTGIGQRP